MATSRMRAEDELGGGALGETLEFLVRIWRLNHALEQLSARMDRRLGVTAQQRFVIRCVGKYPGIIASRLARILHLDAGTISTALARLETKRLVERRRDERDRRRVSVVLTPAGAALDQSMEGTVESAVAELCETRNPKDLAATKRSLEALTRLIDAQGRSASHDLAAPPTDKAGGRAGDRRRR
jgi:DNA-binding MarR family transcriptional regulator